VSGVKCAAVIDWPKAIHEGNGRCVFIVDPATTDQQVQALAQVSQDSLALTLVTENVPVSEEQSALL
jgi:hypothetical protein